MPNRTDIRSLKHVFALGALSLALSLPGTLLAQQPSASLMDLPGDTPHATQPLPDASALKIPAEPAPAPVTAPLPITTTAPKSTLQVPEAVPSVPLPAAQEALPVPTVPVQTAPVQAAPLVAPVQSTPLQEIPSAPVGTTAAPATTPAPQAEAPKEVTRTVQIVPPKIITVQGTPSIELLEHPIKLDGGLSLMFSEKDMFTLVIPSIELYDKAEDPSNKTSGNTEATDDLTGLLESLKFKGEDKVKEVQQPLPNIYLGSIMYYSNSNWSIWLNGKKVTNALNSVANPLYVESIDRSHVRLVWKPTSMNALNKVLNDRKIATPEVLDIDGSKVTVTMRPNQTFVTSLLAVLEGMVRQTAMPEPAPGTGAAEPANAAPATAPAMPERGMPMDKRKR